MVDTGARLAVPLHGECPRRARPLHPVPGLDFDKLAASARLQYVDANNDQAYSPYIAYSPRWDFTPLYRNWFGTRQDLNFGVNKIFNFDAGFSASPSRATPSARRCGRSE